MIAVQPAVEVPPRSSIRGRPALLPLLGLAAIMVAGAALLFTHLGLFAPNNDEAIFVWYAHVAAHAHRLPDLFGSFSYAAPPLFTWLGAIALRLHPDPAAQLATVRAASVLCGIGTIAGVYALAQELYADAVLGLVAAVLYVFCPYAVMYNRLALLDALVQFIGVLVAIQSVRLFRQPVLRDRHIVLLGILLGLGQLAKGISVFFWLLPLLSWYFFDPGRSFARLRRAALIATPVALALYATVLLSGNPRNFLRPFFTAIKYSVATSPTHFNFEQSRFPLLAYFVHNLGDWISWQQNYVGYALLGGLVVAVVLSTRWGLRADRFLAIWLAIPLFLMLFTKVYDSRYVVFTIPIEVLLVSRATLRAWRYARQLLAGRTNRPALQGHGTRLALGGALVAVLALGGAYTAQFDATHDAKLVSDPLHGYYDPFDRWYFVTGWLSGYGLDQAEAYIRGQAQHRDITVLVGGNHLPFVGVSYGLADDPHVRIQPLTTQDNLQFPPGMAPPRPPAFAVLDVPKDNLQAVQAAHPTWRVLKTWTKPGGQSAFVVMAAS